MSWLDPSRAIGSLIRLAAFTFPVCAASAAVRAEESVQFNRDVRPILAENCLACHGFDKSKRQARLRLDTADGATAMLESGARAVVPGDADTSELIRRVSSHDPESAMPPRSTGKRLTSEQVAILRRWIAQGAHFEEHWAFRPPARGTLPESPGGADPIDRFVQVRLAAAGFASSPEADPTTLARRVSLDLIGLPPTIEELDAFLADHAADPTAAYASLVDRLLESPHYGERWGRWWLDQARYADSNGYSIDAPRQIWKYRDWVIDSLNADMPFDQFTIEQLAGDLLPDATERQRVATGFHRNTQINQEGGIDREQFRIDSVFDRVATTGTVWLGLTIGCAQCHDHKFDPIEQREYYRFFAFLNNQDEPTMQVFGPERDGVVLASEEKSVERQLAARIAERADALRAWESAVADADKAKLPKEAAAALAVAADKRTPAQQRALFAAGPGAHDETFRVLHARFARLEAELASAATTMVMAELARPRKTTILIQGDFTRPGDEVAPGTPAVLPELEVVGRTGNRLDLARWIASPRNTLTARVIMNRLWQQYFGRGLVATDNDFGLIGTPPSHPQLLDWLALEFIDRRWSLKEMHRVIVTSRTYRQSSVDRPDLRERDPDNELLGRQRRLRLDAELVRDVALAASGLLSRKIGGPPVFPPIPDGVMSRGQVKHDWVVSQGEDRFRRGIYTFLYRATPPPSLSVFDAPDGYASCTRRNRSNTPLQALTLLNDATFFEFASGLERVIQSHGIESAFRRATSRRPDADELAVLGRLDPLAAARVILNLDETVTRE